MNRELFEECVTIIKTAWTHDTFSFKGELLWSRYRDVAQEHGRDVPRGEEAAWGGYLVLAGTKSQAEAWAEDCAWMWQAWSTPFGQDMPPMLVGDPDTVTRMIEDAARHVPFREVFLLFGQGVLDRDKCLTTLELLAEKVIPRFRE